MRKFFSPSKKNIFKAAVFGLSLTFCNVNSHTSVIRGAQGSSRLRLSEQS